MADAEAAGLAVESRFATFDLRPFDPEGDFGVFVLASGGRGGPSGPSRDLASGTDFHLTGSRDGCCAISLDQRKSGSEVSDR